MSPVEHGTVDPAMNRTASPPSRLLCAAKSALFRQWIAAAGRNGPERAAGAPTRKKARRLRRHDKGAASK
jgi:hypothetical protein